MELNEDSLRDKCFKARREGAAHSLANQPGASPPLVFKKTCPEKKAQDLLCPLREGGPRLGHEQADSGPRESLLEATWAPVSCPEDCGRHIRAATMASARGGIP